MQEYEEYLRYEQARSPHTVKAYLKDLTQFKDFCIAAGMEEFPADIVDAPLIRRWISTLAEAGDTPASLRRKTQSLRAFFKYLCKRKGLASNPANDVILAKLPRPLPDYIADQDLQRLMHTLPSVMAGGTAKDARDHLILHLLYATGLRCSELLSLTDANLTISNGEGRINVAGKGKKERVVPLAPELIREIHSWQTLRDAEYPDLPTPRPIIATRHGAMSDGQLRNIIKRLLKDENAGRKSPHTLRHSFATSMLNGGADLNTVRAILGHESLATTQIYTHLQFTDIKDIYTQAHPRGKEKNC